MNRTDPDPCTRDLAEVRSGVAGAFPRAGLVLQRGLQRNRHRLAIVPVQVGSEEVGFFVLAHVHVRMLSEVLVHGGRSALGRSDNEKIGLSHVRSPGKRQASILPDRGGRFAI